MSKKPVFQEVASTAPKARRQTGMIDAPQGKGSAMLRAYLALLFFLVLAMVFVGGATRLTDSGLSITEWRVLTGIFPPLSVAEWEAELAKYREICQYQLVNRGMSLSEFQFIYWWEWAHRFLGRFLGLVWVLGYAGLALTGRVGRGWHGRILLLGALGGLQAVIGWWMVSSGVFECRVEVSSVRLAVHLGLAFFILGLLVRFWMRAGRTPRDLLSAERSGNAKLARRLRILAALVFVQVLAGALVAGIDAGRSFTDWPTMGGGFLPPEPLGLTPLRLNFIENDGLVQFIHRMLGYLVVIKGLWVWGSSRSSANRSIRKATDLAAALLVVQLVLGILTVMSLGALGLAFENHVYIALLHQLGAAALLAATIRAAFIARFPLPQSLREA